MPMLAVRSNADLDALARDAFLVDASRQVADALGKPERFVMVSFEGGLAMLFAEDAAPTAFMELRSLGLPEERTPELSRLLCDLADRHLGVAASRVFINFADVARSMWGWDGRTF